MKIAGLDVLYLSHVCFAFRLPTGETILTDPLFADGFSAKRHFERYLSPPSIPVESIRECTAIFVSHIHGDHFDPQAIATIVGNTGAEVWAPPEVIDALRVRMGDGPRLVALADGDHWKLGEGQVQFFAGYDNACDDQARPNKFSFSLRIPVGSIFYSGDCHQAPPGMIGHGVDAVFSWVHPNDSKLKAFIEAVPSKAYVLMHGDRFDPGDFYCNADAEAEKRRVLRFAPNMTVIAPERVTTAGEMSGQRPASRSARAF